MYFFSYPFGTFGLSYIENLIADIHRHLLCPFQGMIADLFFLAPAPDRREGLPHKKTILLPILLTIPKVSTSLPPLFELPPSMYTRRDGSGETSSPQSFSGEIYFWPFLRPSSLPPTERPRPRKAPNSFLPPPLTRPRPCPPSSSFGHGDAPTHGLRRRRRRRRRHITSH